MAVILTAKGEELQGAMWQLKQPALKNLAG